MPTVVGVRLRFSKTLWFDPAGTTPVEGDTVIVETERGTELGTIVHAPYEVSADDLPAPLKPVMRIADEEDLAYAEELAELERKAMPVFRQLVVEQKLDMKPVDVEYLFSGDKVVFYFSSDERIDFRELVKELASRFRARIDMRQVGVRDEARMVGGVGHCGQVLCCARMGGEFQPVSIRMAKEQDLPLNPLKISGLCGRLMCCLRYEFDAYKDFKSRAPKKGAMIETPTGEAKVTELNTPRETVTLRLADGERTTVPLSGMTCAKGGSCPCCVSAETLEQAAGAKAPIVAPIAAATPALKESEPLVAPEPPKEGGGRRRRRRKSGGSAESAGQAAPKATEPKRSPRQSPKQAPKQAPAQGGADAPKQAASQPSAEGDAKPRSGRRRRRRRSGGGGGTGAPSAE